MMLFRSMPCHDNNLRSPDVSLYAGGCALLTMLMDLAPRVKLMVMESHLASLGLILSDSNVNLNTLVLAIHTSSLCKTSWPRRLPKQNHRGDEHRAHDSILCYHYSTVHSKIKLCRMYMNPGY